MVDISGIVKQSQGMRGPALKGAGRGLNINFEQQRANMGLSNALRDLGRIAEWASSNVKETDYSEYVRANFTQKEINTMMKEGKLLSIYNQTTVDGVKGTAGFLAQQEVHKELAHGIENGTIKDQKDLMKAFHDQSKVARQIQALNMNIQEDDEAFLQGFAKGNDAGMLNLFNTLATKNAGKLESTVIAQHQDIYNKVTNDTQLMFNGQAGDFIFTNIEKDWEAGRITSPKARDDIISGVVSTMTTKNGGLKFLIDNEDRVIEMGGVKSSLKSHYGPEKWELIKEKARAYQTNSNRAFRENIELGIVGLETKSVDEADRWIRDQLETINQMYPDEHTNQLRDLMVGAKKQLQHRINQEILAQRQDIARQDKMNNDVSQWLSIYSKAVQGDKLVSTSQAMYPELSKESNIQAAKTLVQGLEQQIQDPVQRNKLLMKYLSVSSPNDGFQTLFGEQFKRGADQLSAAVLNGQLPEDPQAMQVFDKMLEFYKSDPSTLAQIFPEQAETFYYMDLINNRGISKEQLVTALNSKKGKSDTQRMLRDDAWREARKGSKKGLAWLSDKDDKAARVVYDASYALHGDENRAIKDAEEFVGNMVYKYESSTKGEYSNEVFGAIPKTFLNVRDNPQSWSEGREIVDEAIEEMRKSSRRVNVLFHETNKGGYVSITSHDGLNRVILDKDFLKAKLHEKDVENGRIELSKEEQMDRALKENRESKGKLFNKYYQQTLTSGIKTE